MFKRLFVYLILTSMIFHCAGRLGILDSLYQQRHRIAYNLGLIAEIPIAICSGDYDFDSKLRFQSDDNNEASTPIHYQLKEITLFFIVRDFQVAKELEIVTRLFNSEYTFNLYKSPDRTIFQPPKI